MKTISCPQIQEYGTYGKGSEIVYFFRGATQTVVPFNNIIGSILRSMVNAGALYVPNNAEAESSRAFEETIKSAEEGQDILYYLPDKSLIKTLLKYHSKDICVINDGGTPQHLASYYSYSRNYYDTYCESLYEFIKELFPLHERGIFFFIIDDNALRGDSETFLVNMRVLDSGLGILKHALHKNRIVVDGISVILANSKMSKANVGDYLKTLIPVFIDSLHDILFWQSKKNHNIEYFSLGNYYDCRDNDNYSYQAKEADSIASFILQSSNASFFNKLKSLFCSG